MTAQCSRVGLHNEVHENVLKIDWRWCLPGSRFWSIGIFKFLTNRQSFLLRPGLDKL